ncbi:unnamed protein product, partial [Meganyctiphanes norvegica]
RKMHNAYKKRILKAWVPDDDGGILSENQRSEGRDWVHTDSVVSSKGSRVSNECLGESLVNIQKVAETAQQQQEQQQQHQQQELEHQQKVQHQQQEQRQQQQHQHQSGGRRKPCCKLCHNHGIDQINRGHKHQCPYRTAEHIRSCRDCKMTEEKRKSTREEQKNMRAKKARPPSPPMSYCINPVSAEEYPRMKELENETRNIIDTRLFDQINNKVLRRT